MWIALVAHRLQDLQPEIILRNKKIITQIFAQKKTCQSTLSWKKLLLCQHPNEAPALFVISEWQGVHKQEAFDVAAPHCSFDAHVSAKDVCLLIRTLTSGKKAVYINILITPWSFLLLCVFFFHPKDSDCLRFELNTLQITPVLTCRLHPVVPIAVTHLMDYWIPDKLSN